MDRIISIWFVWASHALFGWIYTRAMDKGRRKSGEERESADPHNQERGIKREMQPNKKKGSRTRQARKKRSRL